PAAQRLEQALREAGIQVAVARDAQSALWLKLAGIVSVGTITAYGRCTIGEAFADTELAKLMEDACAETEAVARARGIQLPPGAGGGVRPESRSVRGTPPASSRPPPRSASAAPRPRGPRARAGSCTRARPDRSSTPRSPAGSEPSPSRDR